MTPAFLEDHISQIPALQLLMKVGYKYLTPTQAMEYRKDNRNVLLDEVLFEQLKRLNTYEYRGRSFDFTDSTHLEAIEKLKRMPLVDGLIRANEKVYDLLTLGTSFEQTIGYDRKSFSYKYIDWKNPENNVYHVTEEFEVQRIGKVDTYRPDIVLFVNGIPLAVIECKRPDLKQYDPLSQAISQHLRNQKEDGIQELFKYNQLQFAICGDRGKYATTGTEEKFWATWREQEPEEEKLTSLKNTPLSKEQKADLFSTRFRYVSHYFDELESLPVQVTEQDRLLYYLCQPARMLDLVYRFLLYDAGVKKVTRYQQYFAVRKTVDRVRPVVSGKRQGGVIYHTQGSGKSLTMVMMAKSLALEPTIKDAKILLVTDRIDLDDQIFGTFKSCGMEDRLVQAESGKHLLKILKSNKASIITTLIGKFETLLESGSYSDPSHDIFVLVDESHRSQYGIANRKMMEVLPNACYIGFTGTPLLKTEKSTAMKFGGFIDSYTILQGVEDGAIVPLIYEGREAVQNVQNEALDAFFDRVCKPLNEFQKSDLKRKFARADQLNEADQKIRMIAYDISDHYVETWQNSGFKGQLTAPSKYAAIRYKQAFDDYGMVKTEVLISGPDTRENNETYLTELEQDLVLTFWKNMMTKFGSEENYNRQLISQFKKSEEIEIIIVVDKLLVGFDAPKNVVLYIARSLKEHGLLQAVARVNRLAEGKDFGYILDYYGILGNLEEALTTYTALQGFAPEDITGTLTSVWKELDKLPELHATLVEIFTPVENKLDIEPYSLLLADVELRKDFYKALNQFSKTLKLGFSTLGFEKKIGEERAEMYRKDAEFFHRLRVAVQSRYTDTVDYRQYEKQIQKLIDNHVSTYEVIRLTEQVNIFDQDAFRKQVEKIEGVAARADTIASRTAKHISEKMEEDPVFYTRFSKLLQQVIDDFHDRRISELEFLEKATEIMNKVRDYTDMSLPGEVKGNESAQAFFRTVKQILEERESRLEEQKIASASLAIDGIIRQNQVVDWTYKEDVILKMKQQIDEYLYDLVQEERLNYSADMLDEIIDKTVEIAKHRY